MRDTAATRSQDACACHHTAVAQQRPHQSLRRQRYDIMSLAVRPTSAACITTITAPSLLRRQEAATLCMCWLHAESRASDTALLYMADPTNAAAELEAPDVQRHGAPHVRRPHHSNLRPCLGVPPKAAILRAACANNVGSRRCTLPERLPQHCRGTHTNVCNKT